MTLVVTFPTCMENKLEELFVFVTHNWAVRLSPDCTFEFSFHVYTKHTQRHY